MHSLRSGYRFWYWKNFVHYLDPMTYVNWVKHYYQRATRGWADCDTWGLDNYLSEWLPDALRHLKKHKYGIPCTMFTDEELNHEHEDGFLYPTEDAQSLAEIKWNGILDKMILGFEAYNRMEEGLYEDELGPYPDFDWDKINDPDPVRDNRYRETIKLTARDQAIFEEGAELFIKHFGSLWD